MTGTRLALRRPTLPTARAAFSAVAVAVKRRRQRVAEREYRRAVARGHLPREFGTPFYKEVQRQRWYR
ncbi:MAG: hypothetical protein M3065_11340 [Actinomycetota bacterium]|nr:hypothetical protein [Actinomycetota bacterium]